ncbi:putative ABC transporter ATP-binding protein YbhF [Clostridium tepidiprofundi DSM 19306]|uniref:Putative ABC transporter ATP-binding protein YbhF n=1 Tax=Clostridium tepidiprofundi DSM 19306 TaxID=1121338 RepID=A0A151AT48_9CLOT|nr:ABC transporter ATP-binding protein [Clostridium tepidiprofundi]KYH30834.1 putative ABC transporter ATP-binding protein YbhF [Clostridium tepidiprofundi DSM 19306]
MSIVKIEELTKKFGDIIAVDDVNIEIKEGEIYGLLGPNGAGKSTMINIMCGLLRATKGKVKILDKDINEHSMFVKKNIGVVPQNIAIYEDLTAYENVKFFASLYGLKGNVLKERTKEALEFVGLYDRSKSIPKNFSGGMKRRLNIACALAHKPNIIIMDEPTVGIDPQSRNHILKSIKKLNDMGSTIIYTTHYMEEAEAICTKIGIMDHGKIIAEGTKEELEAIVTDKKRLEITVNDIGKVEIECLKQINGVVDIMVTSKKVIIDSKKEVNNLEKIILYFTQNGFAISNIESKMPNLENVFLTLTGRKLRD